MPKLAKELWDDRKVITTFVLYPVICGLIAGGTVLLIQTAVKAAVSDRYPYS